MTEVEEWLGENCPTLNTMRKKRKPWPQGFILYSRAPTKEEILAENPLALEFPPGALEKYCRELGEDRRETGRLLLQELEVAFEELSQYTELGRNFRDLVIGAKSEKSVKDLLTEVNVCNALCRILESPELSPTTRPGGKGEKGKNCDLKGLFENQVVWFEIKTYEDTFKGGARALSQRAYEDYLREVKRREQEGRTPPPPQARPRAEKLREKLDGRRKKDQPSIGVPEQFKDGELNLVIVNEGPWDGPQHLASACFGDHRRMCSVKEVDLEDESQLTNGLFADDRWKIVSAVALVQANHNSISLIWFMNPRANIPIPRPLLETLCANFSPKV